MRAYELQEIKKVATLYTGVHTIDGGLTRQVATAYTVSDLFSLVKQYDESFKPNPASEIVNEDGQKDIKKKPHSSSMPKALMQRL